MLDHRVLKTPARQPLVVPTQALALAIAAEWEWQVCALPPLCFLSLVQPYDARSNLCCCVQAKRIQPFTMPLMSLAATAIDQPKSREAVIETMLQYLHTDPVCCRHEPGKMADLQHKV